MSSTSAKANFHKPEEFWPKKPGATWLFWPLRYLLELAVRCLYWVRFEGLENIPRKGAAILAPNHVSALDPVFIAIGIRRRVTALGNARYFKGKNGWFFRAMGQIPLVPGNDKSKKEAFECIEQILHHGGMAGVFPEGNRALDGKLHRGHTGVAILAQNTKAPVIPIGVIGSYKVYPKGKKIPRFFRKITIRIGRPIVFDDSSQVREFTDRIMAEIRELSGQEYVDTYSERT